MMQFFFLGYVAPDGLAISADQSRLFGRQSDLARGYFIFLRQLLGELPGLGVWNTHFAQDAGVHILSRPGRHVAEFDGV